MKENETFILAHTFWKIFFPIASVGIALLVFFGGTDIWVSFLFILLFIAAVVLTVMVVRLKLVIDYQNNQIIYYSVKKQVINFCDVKSCYSYTENIKDNSMFIYINLLKTDGSEIKISCNFVAFTREGFENKRKEIAKIVASALKNAEETLDTSLNI